MDLILHFVILVVSLVFLIKGADWFVDGASDIAKTFKIPSLVIGLTIVAFGTSAPEAAVSISASVTGSAGVALGNVMGSNIFNLLMVIGVSSCIRTLKVERSIVLRDYPYNILITLVCLTLMADVMLSGGNSNVLSRSDGIVLLSFFSIFMYYTVAGAMKQRVEMKEEKPERKTPVSVMLLIVGIVCVVAGGHFTVESACDIARYFKVSENMIALTIIAVGTSLPELVTSIVALRKGESDIAVGNVIGSNLFNLLFIIGISSLISPIAVDADAVQDALILTAVNFVVFAFMLKNKSTGRVAGGIMVLMYIAFAVFVVLRGINLV